MKNKFAVEIGKHSAAKRKKKLGKRAYSKLMSEMAQKKWEKIKKIKSDELSNMASNNNILPKNGQLSTGE